MNSTNELDFLAHSAGALAQLQAGFDQWQRTHFTRRPPEFFALELNGEAGELANLEKKTWKGKTIPAEQFADEAADVLIALMNYANARGVDLESAVATKCAEIARRRNADPSHAP